MSNDNQLIVLNPPKSSSLEKMFQNTVRREKEISVIHSRILCHRQDGDGGTYKLAGPATDKSIVGPPSAVS